MLIKFSDFLLKTFLPLIDCMRTFFQHFYWGIIDIRENCKYLMSTFDEFGHVHGPMKPSPQLRKQNLYRIYFHLQKFPWVLLIFVCVMRTHNMRSTLNKFLSVRHSTVNYRRNIVQWIFRTYLAELKPYSNWTTPIFFSPQPPVTTVLFVYVLFWIFLQDFCSVITCKSLIQLEYFWIWFKIGIRFYFLPDW